MQHPTIHIEGGIFPADLLDQIASGEAPGQRESDFQLEGNARLSDEIAAAWSDARAFWNGFSHAQRSLRADDPGTSITRDSWVRLLLQALGYTLEYRPNAELVDGKTFAISHRAISRKGQPPESAPPVHIQGFRIKLDERPPSGRPRLSAHSLVQEYLNHTEHVWGIVTNGLQLRLVRDCELLTRQPYIEFDLEAMLNGDNFADFGILYRLVHRTRLPHGLDDADQCWLERYYKQSLDQGNRVREGLRNGVEVALKALGNGFLSHPKSAELVHDIAEGRLAPLDYYRQLLRLVYRFLFLFASEERGLIGSTDARLALVYTDHYSLSRLRPLAERPPQTERDYHDIWLGLVQTTFRIHADPAIATKFGMTALNGDLFGERSMTALDKAFIGNHALLTALGALTRYHDKNDGLMRRVNFGALDVEELGSVYESLLDFHPVVEGTHFELVSGTERKTTGSYYTRPELVAELIKSALEPVIADRLEKAGKDPKAQIAALKGLTVCDPACGSGHFLLAAARRIGRELARIESGEPFPPPERVRLAVREAIRHCIYGVDKNPLAVDLCRVALWLEGHARGYPVTFLDHHIKCGDSLVGVFDLNVLHDGIPDGAYTAVSGDDKATARQLRDRNKKSRAGQATMDLFGTTERKYFADTFERLNEMSDDTAEAVTAKRKRYEQSRQDGSEWGLKKLACDLWTAAFFAHLRPSEYDFVPLTQHVDDPAHIDRFMLAYVHRLSEEINYFHWPLEFPEVFEQGGFDAVLGNPPWERIKLEEREFFASRDYFIATAKTAAIRKNLIDDLKKQNQSLLREFEIEKHVAEAMSKFTRQSNRFSLTAVGDVNTYALFAGWPLN